MYKIINLDTNQTIITNVTRAVAEKFMAVVQHPSFVITSV